MVELYNDVSKDIEEGYLFLNKLESIFSEIQNNYLRLKDTKKILKRGGIDETTFATVRNEILENTCRRFIEYMDILSNAENVLTKLKVVYTKMILEIEKYRKGQKSVYVRRADEFMMLTSRAKMLKQNIDKLAEKIENIDVDLAFFLLESFTEKANELHYLDYTPRIVEFAKKIGDKWSEERMRLESRLSDMEKEIEKINEELEELEIRYSIGEFDRIVYDEKRIKLENKRQKLEENIKELENKLEENDSFFLKIFEKLELLQSKT